MTRYHIPTANYETFTEKDAAIAYLHTQQFPIVIKEDGLAAGKGVVIAQNEYEAIAAAERFLQSKHPILIEDYLEGDELSFMVITDGVTRLALETTQDYKKRDDGNLGPNTGGMGARSPAPMANPELSQRILNDIIDPVLQGIKHEGCPYTGILYAGLMITPEGKPKVLEFNCRLGDPETEALMVRLKSDFAELCLATLHKKLDQYVLSWDTRPALGVVLAAGGYPDSYEKSLIITGLHNTYPDSIKLFHAGTAQHENHVVTNGGRVLCVTALGATLENARIDAYQAIHTVSWPEMYYRKDIGL